MDENYSKLVDIAFNMHKSGKLEDAKLVYEKLLSISPDDLDVLNLYAQLNFSLKNYDLAIDLFKNVYDKTKLVDIAEKVALSAFKASKYELSIEFFKKCLENNNDFTSNYHISLCYKELNQINKAIEYALAAFNIKQNELDLCIHLSYLYEKSNDLDSAIKYLDCALQINYNEQLIYNMGVLFKKQKKYHDAVFCFEKVLELNPSSKSAMLNIASTYKNISMTDALQIYKDIETIYPDDLKVKFFIYTTYYDMFDFENAIKVAKNLVELDPTNVDYYKMLGDCYYSQYNYEQAFEWYKKAEEVDPQNSMIKTSIAEMYFIYSDYDKALEYLYSAGRTIADFIDISLKRKELLPVIDAFTTQHIKKKDKRESEKKAKSFFYKFNIAEKYNVTEEYFVNQKSTSTDEEEKIIQEYYKKNPSLDVDLTNKNVLIYCAHGIGDFLMFSRYINVLKEKVNSLILYIPKSLERIVRTSFPYVKVYLKGNIVPSEEYDYAISEFVLISFTTRTLKEIPYSSNYLSVTEDLIEEKKKIIKSDNSKKKIGIFWQGNPTILYNRSIKLKYMLPIIEMADIQVYSFQISNVDLDSDELKKQLPIIDLAPLISDYADTGAFLKNIDILITIDSSIANLAGAMGIKTYLLLPFDSEWRWFDDNCSTPWYDSVKIFKQNIPNDWEEVISRVKNEI